ncbi:MAG: Bax inhibitor-1/YccA family protein [bacterium]
MRTANPALNYEPFGEFGRTATMGNTMSIQGTVNKTALLLVLALISSVWTWSMYYSAGNAASIRPLVFGGGIGGLIIFFITLINKQWAFVTAPIYALLEGLVLGGISAIFDSRFPGIVIQAVALTFGTLFCLLLGYSSGKIRLSARVKLGITAAIGAIFLFYLTSLILGLLFGIRVPFIHESGIIGIGFSIFVVIIAALNLVLDFEFIAGGAASGAPKYMEWYGAFALIVTLIWLYLEIIRLLAKLKEHR